MESNTAIFCDSLWSSTSNWIHLSKGADVNIRDIDGKSCLTEAKLSLHGNIAKMIEECGRNEQESTYLNKDWEPNIKLEFSYASCNEDDEEMQASRQREIAVFTNKETTEI